MMSNRRFSDRQEQSKRSGAALVEMAIVLPVFLVLILGVIEFGRAMMISQLVTNAARDGARLAAADGSSNSSVKAAVEEFLAESIGLSGSDFEVVITVTAGAGNDDPGNVVANASPGDKCTVTVFVPFDKVALTKPKFLSGKNLTGFCTMRREW